MSGSLYDISELLDPLAQGVTVLTPNQRLARHILAQWDSRQAATGREAWERPAVFALQHWLERQWELAVATRLLPPRQRLSASQVRQVWRRIINRSDAPDGELALLEPAAAAELAANARNTLLSWRVDWQDTRWRHLFNLDQDSRAFAHWLSEFERTLTESGQATVLDCLAALAQLARPMVSAPVLLLECEGASPLLESAARTVCSDLESVPLRASMAEQRVYSFEDPAQQRAAVADWAAHTYRTDPGARIGIVLTDMNRDRGPFEYQLRRAFDCLGADYGSLPVNFSTGIALSHAPVVRDALRALALGLQQTTVPDVVRVMNSRYLDLPDATGPLALDFVQKLFAAGARTVTVARLRTLASECRLGDEEGLELGRILMGLAQDRDQRGKALPGEWATRFSAVLERWGWPADAALDSLEFQQVSRWFELLESFKQLDSVCEPLDYAAALTLLREQASEAISQPQTADTSVQVLGPLEAIGLQFEHLWLVGMQASRWPESPRPNPFLPVGMQTELGMPRADAKREWDIAALRLAQYARAVGVIHATYARQDDGIVEFPSPQLEGFTASALPAAPAVPSLWQERLAEAQWEARLDDRAPPMTPEEQASLAGGSALLEDQAQCPFRAFAARRLDVAPLGEFSLALSPAERGSVLHDALYSLWGALADHRRLVSLEETQLDHIVAEAAHAGLARVHARRRGDLPATYWNLERTRLERLLREWLALEQSRTEFVVRAREEKVTLPLAQLTLTLRIDRIDELPDKSRVIMDYKSSASSIGDWMGERPAKPQLLLYGLAAPGLADGLAFAQVRADDCKFVGLGKTAFAPGVRTDLDKYVEDEEGAWEALNARWADALQALAQAFVDGEAQVDPLSASSCTWCGLQSLCRVDRQLALGSES